MIKITIFIVLLTFSILGEGFLLNITCPSGTYISNGNCLLCPPGTVSIFPETTECKKCELGSRDIERKLCTPCPENMFFDKTQGCKYCPAGSYLNGNNCVFCPAGFYSEGYGQGCIECQPGKYANIPNSSYCSKCKFPKYSDKYGTVNCKSCPKGQVSYNGLNCEILCPPGQISENKIDNCRDITFLELFGMLLLQYSYQAGTFCIILLGIIFGPPC